jgi:expansin (peptidoglycan-binding protein)
MTRPTSAALSCLSLLAWGCSSSDGASPADAGKPDVAWGSGGLVDGATPEAGGDADDQTVCSRTVPDSVMPSIDCTPKVYGQGWDGCSANTPCGSVTGCLGERGVEPMQGTITTDYAPGSPDFVPPGTKLPAAGTSIDAVATGWFARGDGTLATGSCALPPVRDIMVAALSSKQFGSAEWCGACAEVVGLSGWRVRIMLIDQCTGCTDFGLDMGAGEDSPFNMIDDPSITASCRVASQPIRWKIVPCEVAGGVIVDYLEGFNAWTPAVRIRNYRIELVKLEERISDAWVELPRTADNKYLLTPRSSDAGGSNTLRFTAIDGARISGTFPPFEPGARWETTTQF